MKKYCILGLVLLLVLSVVLTGCAPQPAAPEETQADDELSAVLSGGWEVYDGSSLSVVSDEERAIFEKAAEGMVGAEMQPVAVLATQLVAGMNYAFLCTSTPVVPNAQPSWVVAVVYHDLQGNDSITWVRNLELGDMKTQEHGSDEDIVGGWAISEHAAAAALPEDAQKAFDTASENFDGVSLSPVALLGTQVVAGTNYNVLCFGTTVTATPVTCLYAVRIYADLQGGAEITDVEDIDFLYYVTPDVE